MSVLAAFALGAVAITLVGTAGAALNDALERWSKR